MQSHFYILSVPQVVATLKLRFGRRPMGCEKKRKVNRLLKQDTATDHSPFSAEEGRIVLTPKQTGPIPHVPYYLGARKRPFGPGTQDTRRTAYQNYGSAE